jgi:hypothetical protein
MVKLCLKEGISGKKKFVYEKVLAKFDKSLTFNLIRAHAFGKRNRHKATELLSFMQMEFENRGFWLWN